MVRALLVRGMLVGVVAGLISFGFLKVYGEPQLERALTLETHHEHERHDHAAAGHEHAAAGHEHEHAAAHEHAPAAGGDEDELVSRSVQAGIGLLTGVVVYSAAFGGLFGLAFAFAYGRLGGGLSAQGLAALLAAVGFVVVYLVPSLKYPANPPAVGNAETIGLRTALYFVMIALSLAAMIAAVSIKRVLAPRYGEWNANLITAVCYIVLMIAVGLALPTVNEVPDGFPAVVLWQFRIASIGAQLIMWTTLGLLFGALTHRAAAADAVRRVVASPSK